MKKYLILTCLSFTLFQSVPSMGLPIDCSFDGYKVSVKNYSKVAYKAGNKPIHKIQIKDEQNEETHMHDTKEAFVLGCGVAFGDQSGYGPPTAAIDFSHRGKLHRLAIHYCGNSGGDDQYTANLVIGKERPGRRNMDGKMLVGTCVAPGFRKSTSTTSCSKVCERTK